MINKIKELGIQNGHRRTFGICKTAKCNLHFKTLKNYSIEFQH